MTKFLTILTTGLMAVILANPATADDNDTPKQPPKASSSVLTDESLGVMLEQLGFEPKANKTNSGSIFYNVDIEHEGWTLPYIVELSPNKKFVWISISICTLSEGQQPSAEVLQKLMEENDRNGPAKISFSKQSRKIILALALFNHGITAKVVREQLTYLHGQVQTVSKLCEGLRNGEK